MCALCLQVDSQPVTQAGNKLLSACTCVTQQSGLYACIPVVLQCRPCLELGQERVVLLSKGLKLDTMASNQ
jgi:hypothetical protein